MSDLHERSATILKVRTYIKENVNDDEVHQNDREHVRDVLCDIFLFDPAVPVLKTNIIRAGDHYNCLIKGWKRPIALLEFCKTFIDPDSRDNKYDVIQKDCAICPEQEDGGPYLIIRIKARATNEKKKHH